LPGTESDEKIIRKQPSIDSPGVSFLPHAASGSPDASAAEIEKNKEKRPEDTLSFGRFGF
jgi:hypothetical protein